MPRGRVFPRHGSRTIRKAMWNSPIRRHCTVGPSHEALSLSLSIYQALSHSHCFYPALSLSLSLSPSSPPCLALEPCFAEGAFPRHGSRTMRNAMWNSPMRRHCTVGPSHAAPCSMAGTLLRREATDTVCERQCKSGRERRETPGYEYGPECLICIEVRTPFCTHVPSNEAPCSMTGTFLCREINTIASGLEHL